MRPRKYMMRETNLHAPTKAVRTFALTDTDSGMPIQPLLDTYEANIKLMTPELFGTSPVS